MMRRPFGIRARRVLLLAVGAGVALAGVAGGVRGQGGPQRSGPERVQPRGEMRSRIVYPPQRIAIRMDHSEPAHRKLRCVRCHEGAGRSRRAADSLIGGEASCRPCHDDRITRDDPSKERCGYCHVGYGEDGARRVPESSFPTARLRFSHAAHVRFGGMKCLECHRGVDRATVGTRAHLPTMRSCMRCHGGARPSAPSECRTCHLTRADGKLRTRWPEGQMTPKPWQRGMHHDREWLVRHRWVAADHGSACASCHRERDCEDCHDGRVTPDRVHPNDWLTIHPQMARRNEPQCTSCHTTQSFCTECHARLGISQMAAPRVRAGARYHPPTSQWVRGPSLHAREARRAMSQCASCHAERDCVQCHGAAGIGVGISPHPPGFASRCGEALARNDRACRTCHGDVAALRRRCD